MDVLSQYPHGTRHRAHKNIYSSGSVLVLLSLLVSLVLYSRLSRILCTSMSMEMSNLSSSALAADTASSSPWFSCTSGARILHSIFINVPATCGCDTLGLFHYLS